MLPIVMCLLLSLFATVADAATIARPSKSFGGTTFINGVVPQASDFNGDADTIYAEFNGNIHNANISTSAAIGPTKINPDGFSVNVRTVNAAPCTIYDESDQGADLRRWAICSSGGAFQISTWTDASALQNNWFNMTRANGGFTIGGASGTNTINGNTTFNHNVTFVGNTSLTPTGMVSLYMGTSAPVGWLLMDGASNSCTGSSSVNANLCAQLVSLAGTVDYKGAASTTVTVDTSSDEVLHTAHGKSVGDRVHFSTTNTLPSRTGGAGVLLNTLVYCIQSITTDRYKIADTCGGAAIDITTSGSGTHSDYFNFISPATAGRVPVGTGSAGTQVEISTTSSGNGFVVVSNNSKWVTGMPVVWSALSGFTTSGSAGPTYYVVRISSTNIRFATTLALAQTGAPDITISGSGSVTITHTYTSRAIGETGGKETHAMTSTELLAHTHDVTNANLRMWDSGPASFGINYGASATEAWTDPVFSTTGGNAAMPIMNPFIGMTYIIKL